MPICRPERFPHYLHTGQSQCYDQAGRMVDCAGSGQDAAYAPGLAWPRPRFRAEGAVVEDRLTGLVWTRDANLAAFPLSWTEALALVARLNRERFAGYRDWRLPNRRELRSLISYQHRRPALPAGHPFQNPFLGWYWTSTSAAPNPAHAWYVHLEGGRMFYGYKEQAYLVWPCRGEGNGALPATGQSRCYDGRGREIACAGSGQDGELRLGTAWPQPRLLLQGDVVQDRLTGLTWTRSADLAPGPLSWQEALQAAERLQTAGLAWRLPTINELESLVDAGQHQPALPAGHPFQDLRQAYWSSTTSAFEPDWAMALYLDKGAVGVGQKRLAGEFFLWAVARQGRP